MDAESKEEGRKQGMHERRKIRKQTSGYKAPEGTRGTGRIEEKHVEGAKQDRKEEGQNRTHEDEEKVDGWKRYGMVSCTG